MDYTVKELSKLAKISIRTLHWYDEIGLFKPTYTGTNGYRYYDRSQLLTLQQILFFKELGFELKEIKNILSQSDFEQKLALYSHKKVLQNRLKKVHQLIKTIDQTIKHLNGDIKMQDHQIYKGFDDAKQKEYQEYLMHRYGQTYNKASKECEVNLKKWTSKDFEKSRNEGHKVMEQLAKCWSNNLPIDSEEVQKSVANHYQWLRQYWTPDQKAYIELGKGYTEFIWKPFFEQYDTKHPEFAKYLARAMEKYALSNL